MTNRKQMFSDRVRFNWGFHDAVFDAARKQPRVTHSTTQDPKHVSPNYDKAYHDGYCKGLEFQKAGLPTDTSDAAWSLK